MASYFDQQYSSFESPQMSSAPMDAGPAFQWGAEPSLSGSGGMFGGSYQSMSPMDFGPASQFGGFGQQEDSTISTAAYNAGSPLGQGEVVQQTPDEPSFFKKLFSGALLGLGTGAGAPDAGTAFSMGFQGVLQQRELERKNAMEQKKFESEMKFQEVQMDSMIADKLYREKQTEYLDDDQRMKMRQLEDQEFQLYQTYGTPLATNVEDTQENRQNLLKTYGSNALVSERDGKLWVFKPDGKLEEDYYIQVPNSDGTMRSVKVGSAGDPLAKVAPFMNTQIQQAFQAEEAEKGRRVQLEVANIGYNATVKSMEQRRQYNDPMLDVALDPIDKALLENYKAQSDPINMRNDSIMQKLKLDNQNLMNQRNSIIRQYQGGGMGAPTGSTSGGAAFSIDPQQFGQAVINPSTGKPIGMKVGDKVPGQNLWFANTKGDLSPVPPAKHQATTLKETMFDPGVQGPTDLLYALPGYGITD